MHRLIFVLTIIYTVSSQSDWDYLTFTQAWPPTLCKFNKCSYPSNIVNSWNIHGLWPSSSTSRDPFNCDDAPPFDGSTIKSIYSELQTQWANLFNFTAPLDFWKHEWTKHGTCALADPIFPNELSYFRNALNIKYKIAIGKIFSDNQIVPSADKTYTTDVISDIIRQSINVTPKLECIFIEEDNNWYLDAIEICLDLNLNFIDCPKRRLEGNEDSLKNLIHGIFENVYQYTMKKKIMVGDKKPVNTPCGEHEFYLPLPIN